MVVVKACWEHGGCDGWLSVSALSQSSAPRSSLPALSVPVFLTQFRLSFPPLDARVNRGGGGVGREDGE